MTDLLRGWRPQILAHETPAPADRGLPSFDLSGEPMVNQDLMNRHLCDHVDLRDYLSNARNKLTVLIAAFPHIQPETNGRVEHALEKHLSFTPTEFGLVLDEDTRFFVDYVNPDLDYSKDCPIPYAVRGPESFVHMRTPEEHRSMGVEFCRYHKYAIALKFFAEARRFGMDTLAHEAYALCNISRSDMTTNTALALADEACAAALEINPYDAITWYNHGTLSITHGARYYESLLRAIELEPEFYAAQFNLGFMCITGDDPKSAIWCYERMLANNPRDPLVLRNCAFAYFADGQVDKSIEYLVLAVQERADVEAWNNMAVAWMHVNQVDMAMACLDKAVECDPYHVIARCNRCAVFRFLRDDTRARLESEMIAHLEVNQAIPQFENRTLSLYPYMTRGLCARVNEETKKFIQNPHL